jgi:hypothetical protein
MDYETANFEYSQCVSAVLVIRQALCMRRIILSSLARLSQTYFFTLSPKRHDLGGGIIEHKMSVLIHCTPFA